MKFKGQLRLICPSCLHKKHTRESRVNLRRSRFCAVSADSSASIHLVISSRELCNLLSWFACCGCSWSCDGRCSKFTASAFFLRPPSKLRAYSTSAAIAIASVRFSGFLRSSTCWLIEASNPVRNRCSKTVEEVASPG